MAVGGCLMDFSNSYWGVVVRDPGRTCFFGIGSCHAGMGEGGIEGKIPLYKISTREARKSLAFQRKILPVLQECWERM